MSRKKQGGDDRGGKLAPLQYRAFLCRKPEHFLGATHRRPVVGGAYLMMPKSKDPNIPVRIAMATTEWPGQSAIQIEELVTRQAENAMTESEYLHEPDARTCAVKSLTLNGISMVQAQLVPKTDVTKAFNDLNLKLADIQSQLPAGAEMTQLNTEFGDAAAVLSAVASPRTGSTVISLHASNIRAAINGVRTERIQLLQGWQRIGLPLAF